MEGRDLEKLGLTFSTPDESGRERELVTNGKERAVTRDSVTEYLNRVAQFKMQERVIPQLEEFKKGFVRVIPMKVREYSNGSTSRCSPTRRSTLWWGE